MQKKAQVFLEGPVKTPGGRHSGGLPESQSPPQAAKRLFILGIDEEKGACCHGNC